MQVAERTESSQKLACVLQERKAQQDLLQCQLHEAQTEWTEAVADHMQLQTDVQSMRRSLEVCNALGLLQLMVQTVVAMLTSMMVIVSDESCSFRLICRTCAALWRHTMHCLCQVLK